VVLTQGENVLKGDRLVIDLKTGESRFENTGNTAVAGGRIRALFMPKEKADTAKSGDAASGQAEGTAQVPVGEPSATSQPAGEGDSTDTSARAAPKSAEPADSPWQIVPGVAQ
jgi:lipopolysaccharide export system protein LptA